MRQYLLDEIARNDIPRVREYLNQHALAASLEDIWWVDLSEDLLSPEQFSHTGCRPFRFAVELGDDFVRFEFLIRGRKPCAAPVSATPPARSGTSSWPSPTGWWRIWRSGHKPRPSCLRSQRIRPGRTKGGLSSIAVRQGAPASPLGSREARRLQNKQGPIRGEGGRLRGLMPRSSATAHQV